MTGVQTCALPISGFARATGAGDHRQLAGANVKVKVFEVVLARAANADDSLGHGLVSFLQQPNILEAHQALTVE